MEVIIWEKQNKSIQESSNSTKLIWSFVLFVVFLNIYNVELKKNKTNNATTSSDSSQNIREANDNNISSSPAIAPDAYSTSPAVSE